MPRAISSSVGASLAGSNGRISLPLLLCGTVQPVGERLCAIGGLGAPPPAPLQFWVCLVAKEGHLVLDPAEYRKAPALWTMSRPQPRPTVG